MKNTRLKVATLAIGSVVMLLAPITAAARDRGDFQNTERGQDRTEQRWTRNDRFRIDNDARHRDSQDAREGNRFHRERPFQDRFGDDRR